MKIFKTLTSATLCSILTAFKVPLAKILREGCLETHIMSHVPFNQSYNTDDLQGLNDSTIMLNCDKPCNIELYDKYKVFSHKLSDYQIENFNETLEYITRVNNSDNYTATCDQNISHTILPAWWTCFERHAHYELKNVLQPINAYQLKDMIGCKITNHGNETEIYQLIISNKTGTVLLIKPYSLVETNETYTNIMKFVFEKFKLKFENFKKHTNMYSMITWHVYEFGNGEKFQTILTTWKDKNIHNHDKEEIINNNQSETVKKELVKPETFSPGPILVFTYIVTGLIFSVGVIFYCEKVNSYAFEENASYNIIRMS